MSNKLDFQVKLDKCEICIQGKQVRNSFKEDGHRANEILEIVHSDVMGPLKKNLFLVHDLL